MILVVVSVVLVVVSVVLVVVSRVVVVASHYYYKGNHPQDHQNHHQNHQNHHQGLAPLTTSPPCVGSRAKCNKNNLPTPSQKLDQIATIRSPLVWYQTDKSTPLLLEFEVIYFLRAGGKLFQYY